MEIGWSKYIGCYGRHAWSHRGRRLYPADLKQLWLYKYIFPIHGNRIHPANGYDLR
jgi:hypothetical protein